MIIYIVINSQSSFITFINWQNLWCFVFSLLFLEFCGGNTCRWTNQMNRPRALRYHVTNASFKLGILLLPKIDRARKNYGTPEIWEEAHSREIFMALWFFNKVVWFVLAAMLEGLLLPSNMAAKTTSSLYLVKRVIVMLRCAVNIGTYFQYFPWSLSAQFVFRKRYFIILKITFWPCDQLWT